MYQQNTIRKRGKLQIFVLNQIKRCSCTKDLKVLIGMAKTRMIELNNMWQYRSIPSELKSKWCTFAMSQIEYKTEKQVAKIKCVIWPDMMHGSDAWALETKKSC